MSLYEYITYVKGVLGLGGEGLYCDTQGVPSRPLIATFTFLDSMAQISVFLNCHSSYPMELMDSRGGSKNS